MPKIDIKTTAERDANRDFFGVTIDCRNPYTSGQLLPDEGYLQNMGQKWMARHLGVKLANLEAALTQWNAAYIAEWNALCIANKEDNEARFDR